MSRKWAGDDLAAHPAKTPDINTNSQFGRNNVFIEDCVKNEKNT